METEMTTNTTDHARSREVERDARAWSKFSGMKYTRALRLMEHPLAQGILGERICARDAIRVLTEHTALSAPLSDADSDGPPTGTEQRVSHLGGSGLWSAELSELPVATEDDYLSLILTAEVLRMFTATAEANSDAYSYNLKHTAEEFLGEHLGDLSYIANGQAIWAAAVIGLPVAETSPGEHELSADFGLASEQVDYARRMRRSVGRQEIRAHHHRPPGYNFLREALQRYRDSGEAPSRWSGIDEDAEPATSPFHEWLVAQATPVPERETDGSQNRLAGDYWAGFRDGDHGVAHQPEDLLEILHEVGAAPEFFAAARNAIVDWARTSPLSTGIRTELIGGDRAAHEGWGAGSGDVEWYEYRCPCGLDKIVEEHDNIPGFREHDVRILCTTCAPEWEFAAGLTVRGWRLIPIETVTSQ